ncbi:unnamed protein product [Brassicogethes aeneus]|uniref:Uncharacterized protein n=1 Tax=Brassicogethes aeneus TaxID=1431903 RepID=A0A9P0AVT0_BRAAE|nr:unnamed protein product [Brassicogethes aeneus]
MLLFFIPIFLFPLISLARLDCSRSEYERCIRIADPLVKEARLVFPDNMNDIDLVCKTWNSFVDCLKFYTENCFTDLQRKQFNRAVESPIESVHQMCMQPSYQKEYLQYATCIKNTIIQNINCGPHYNLLVEQVSQGDVISKSTLCCSQDRFKQCVQRETRRHCDRGMLDGPASKFAGQTIDKALSFLQEQCSNYIPNSGDCAVNTDSVLYADPLSISTSPSEVYPWSTVNDIQGKEVAPSRVPPVPSSTHTWLPSTMDQSTNTQDIKTTDNMLGKRTRPSSYGRSSSWSESSRVPLSGNTVQMYPEVPSTPTSRPDWATVSTWNVMGQKPDPRDLPQNDGTFRSTMVQTSSETWYPAAGNQLNNEVDEPNQLGLKKPRNTSSSVKPVTLAGLVLLFYILFMI